jgi:hypothetical protein
MITTTSTATVAPNACEAVGTEVCADPEPGPGSVARPLVTAAATPAPVASPTPTKMQLPEMPDERSASRCSYKECLVNVRPWKHDPNNAISLEELRAVARGTLHARKCQIEDHDFSMWARNDNCFLRHAAFKVKVMESPALRDKVKSNMASVIALNTTGGGKWSYHTAAVFYTDQGPYVWDPDADDVYEQRMQGLSNSGGIPEGIDSLYPLKQWLDIEWFPEIDGRKPTILLAPPELIAPSDIPDQSADFQFEPTVQGDKYSRLNFRGPDDGALMHYALKRGLKLNRERVRSYRQISPNVTRDSKRIYESCKRRIDWSKQFKSSPSVVPK